MAKENVVVLGANGMLGSDVKKLFRNEQLKAVCYDLPEFDITFQPQLTQTVKNADIIINCAAYTNVDKAENESEKAYKINAEAVGKLGQLAAESDAYIIHISTDFVFDGKKNGCCSETDVPNPINVYGRTKLVGEKLLAESKCRHCIIRVQWTYGAGGNNFIKKIISSAKQKNNLKIVNDQTGSPTATEEIAKVILKMVKQKPEGLFHFASAGYASRFDIAKFILEKLNIKTELTACQSSEFITAATRPLNSSFCCDKIQKLLTEPIKGWQKPLEKFLEQLF